MKISSSYGQRFETLTVVRTENGRGHGFRFGLRITHDMMSADGTPTQAARAGASMRIKIEITQAKAILAQYVVTLGWYYGEALRLDTFQQDCETAFAELARAVHAFGYDLESYITAEGLWKTMFKMAQNPSVSSHYDAAE